MSWDSILAAGITGFLGVVGIVIASRLARGARREMYPSEIIAAQQTQIDGLVEEVSESRRENRLLQDYVHSLRDHISTGKQPPPPPWPAGLTT